MKNRRTSFVGLHVDPRLKKVLIKEAYERGVSVSLLINEMLEKQYKEKLDAIELRGRS